MQVIRDCTGTYLRKDSLDFQVCNIEIVANFDNRTKLFVLYDELNECSTNTLPVCLLYHKNDGWIHVTKIEK